MLAPHSKRFLLALGAFALSLTLPLTGCKEKSVAVPAKPLPVSIVTVRPSSEVQWAETTGIVEGKSESEVRAQVSGILKSITYREGDAVKAGQTLFVLDDAPYRAAFDSAAAAARQAKTLYEQAKREAARYEKLYTAQAVSHKALTDAVSTRDAAAASYSAAMATEEEARINLKRTRVKAAEDGIAGRADVNPGTLVTATSTLLATLTQPNDLRITFQASERDIAGGRITTTNSVRIFDAAGTSYPATLDYVARQMNTASATLTLRAKVEGKGKLIPGQIVRVQYAVATLNNVFRVPQRAVYQKPDGSYQVYVEKNGRARAVTVRVGNWKETDWVVLSGLADGDRVIVNQLQRMKDNLAVSSSSETAANETSAGAQ